MRTVILTIDGGCVTSAVSDDENVRIVILDSEPADEDHPAITLGGDIYSLTTAPVVDGDLQVVCDVLSQISVLESK